MTIARPRRLALLLTALPWAASAQYLGNFDAVNTTGKTAHGFEIELEGLSSADITDTFGGLNRGFATTVERYGAPRIEDYVGGVRVIYSASFDAASGHWLAPGGTFAGQVASIGTPSALNFQTPGDNCWSGGGINYAISTPCDHFGVGIARNPTRTTYSWLVDDGVTPGGLAKAALNLPAPAMVVLPPAQPAAPPVVQARVEAPPPPEPPQGVEPQFGTAIWVKVYTTEVEHALGLEQLMQAPLLAHGARLRAAADGTEIEWQLLQKDPGNPDSGVIEEGGPVAGKNHAVLRRYEFFEFTGSYDAETHEAKFAAGFGDSRPGPGDVGAFIGAQNAQLNLAPVPEPASGALWLAGLGTLGWTIRRRRPR